MFVKINMLEITVKLINMSEKVFVTILSRIFTKSLRISQNYVLLDSPTNTYIYYLGLFIF